MADATVRLEGNRIEVDVLFIDIPCPCGKELRRGDTVYLVSMTDKARRAVCWDCVRPALEEKRRVALLPLEERREAVRAARDAKLLGDVRPIVGYSVGQPVVYKP